MIDALQDVLEEFIDKLNEKLDAHQLEDILLGQSSLSNEDLRYQPEDYTEDNLIWKVLKVVELEKEPKPFADLGGRARWPDFEVINLDVKVIGENKSINKIDEAESDIKDYLDRKSIGAQYGIATDGIEWVVYKIETGGDFPEFPEVTKRDLRPVLIKLAVDKEYIEPGLLKYTKEDIDECLESFVNDFSKDNFNLLLTQKAPQRIREERYEDIEDFYDLYIELLFGEGVKHRYETTLMEDIQAPEGATEIDKRIFAITLVNRLLFVKFLEEQGVLNRSLLSLVNSYEERQSEFTGTLYETQIKPLFYNLLNTPKEVRNPKYRSDWFEEVPYLNGGLFRENIDGESKYNVRDRILPRIIKDLVEGHQLQANGKLDPSVLGSVFEKTINYIGGEVGTQKEIGAYYTPNEITDLVNRRTVDPKIREVLVEVYSSYYSEEVAEKINEYSLEEMLRHIEEGKGWFGNPEATIEAYSKLKKLKVLDPAAGSGHFLTSVMTELHTALMSILRGLNGGRDPTPKEEYELKKEIALNCIYGVDVHPVAIEIAKLRIWLKIIAKGWKPEFGLLPNIDVNIVYGNSLVGFPMEGRKPIEKFSFWDEDINKLMRLRQRYKKENEANKGEIENLLDQIRTKLDELYLKQMDSIVNTRIETVEEFERIIASNNSAGSNTNVKLKLKKSDSTALSREDKRELEELEFTIPSQSKYIARLDVDNRVRKLGAKLGEKEAKKRIIKDLKSLIESGYIYSECRKPIGKCDLENVTGRLFHWPVEFPEVASSEGSNGYSVNFDIVVGNPPYGNVLNDFEKAFINHYETGDINEISANFVEREISLLDERGWFGNITTTGLLNDGSMKEIHNILASKLDRVSIACFARRPSKVFKNAEINVAVTTGRKGNGGYETICTSDFIRFSDGRKERETKFRNISDSPIEGLVLRDKMGGKENKNNYEVLPSVGDRIKEGILRKLSKNQNNVSTILGDSSHKLYYRRSGDYWMNVTLKQLEGVKNMKELEFNKRLYRNFVFLALNSSLFYLYWWTYCNMHDVTRSQIIRFPIPKENIEVYSSYYSEKVAEKINEYNLEETLRHIEEVNEDCIYELTEKLWFEIKANLTLDQYHQFNMHPIKPLIDKIDGFLGSMYRLSNEEIDYVQNYHTEYGRSEP